MEIERRHKKETTWVIKRRDNPGQFILKSEDETDVGSSYSVIMKQGDTELNFKMNREEFQNFISILNGFKDVVLIDETEDKIIDTTEEEITAGGNGESRITSKSETTPASVEGRSEEKVSRIMNEVKSDTDSDLDPTEWDPF